jgi:hypothetical protein
MTVRQHDDHAPASHAMMTATHFSDGLAWDASSATMKIEARRTKRTAKARDTCSRW